MAGERLEQLVSQFGTAFRQSGRHPDDWEPEHVVKVSPYSITERRVPELIPVLGSQPAGDVSHKPDGRLPFLSARPGVTPATLKRAATNLLLGEQRHNGCEQFA